MVVCSKNIIVSLALVVSCFTQVIAHPGGSGLEAESQQWWPRWEDTGQPSLATEQVNMTAILGHTVTLPCRVINLNNRRVSWIRTRDLSVLAVDGTTVTTDARISVVHPEMTDDWLLELRGVAQTDEGTYECQVNTHPKISTKIHLKVIPENGHVSILDMPVSDTGVVTDTKGFSADDGSALRVRVIGRRWVRLAEGSTLRLVCEAAGKELQDAQQYSLRSETLISWTIDDIPATSLFPSSKALVRESWTGTTVESELEVKTMQRKEGGTFACKVAGAQPDLVTVTVVEPQFTEGQAKLSSFEREDSAEVLQSDESDVVAAGTANKAAVISGAIILLLLLIQAGLCVFYIKKV